MAFPVRAALWTALNLLRLLSILASFLVFVSTITSMVADGRGVQAAQQTGFDPMATGCDYYPGTDVPLHVWGIFWVHLNRVFELILLVFCILSEVNWGGMPEKFFGCTLPILSRSFGTVPLGLIQMILACSNLSHELGRFPLVTNWILFVIGILNVIAGAIFKAAGKNVRSFHPSRRELVSAPNGGGGGGTGRLGSNLASEDKMMNKVGGGGGTLPFAYKGTGPRASVKGSLRQLRYVKEAATTGAFPVAQGVPQQKQQQQGASVTGRPSEAFGSPAVRGAGESDMYYYDPDAGKIRMPEATMTATTTSTAGARVGGQSSSTAAGVPRQLFSPAPPPSFTTYDPNGPEGRQPAAAAAASSSYNVAKAVVTRADQLARSQQQAQIGPVPAAGVGLKAGPPSGSVVAAQREVGRSKADDLDADLSNVSSQYHVRYGERGEGYGGHWRNGSGGSLTSLQSSNGVGAAGPMPPPTSSSSSSLSSPFVPGHYRQQSQRTLHPIPEASRSGRPGF